MDGTTFYTRGDVALAGMWAGYSIMAWQLRRNTPLNGRILIFGFVLAAVSTVICLWRLS